MSLFVNAQDHGHLNAGAVAQEQNAPLSFDNGADFITNSLYVKTMSYTNSGKYANYYQGNITLTALHAVDAFGDPVVGGPSPGSFIIAEIVSVNGPAGGAFGFWETNSVDLPTFDIPTGTTNASYRFDLSEASLGAGTPGGDPFGHIHGRRFTASKPGLYAVGFRLWDLSTNGDNAGPIHQPSGVMAVYFQAGNTINSVLHDLGGTTVTFGAGSDANYTVQFNTDLLQPLNWKDVETVAGTDKLVTIPDSEVRGSRGFYRLMVTPIQ